MIGGGKISPGGFVCQPRLSFPVCFLQTGWYMKRLRR